MTERRTLVSGDVLDGRYVLQDLVTDRLGATTWRAHDTLLKRNVGLEMIPSDDARAADFLEAARRSTVVSDPRFLRVLDLVTGELGHDVVVREWARAMPLDQVLAQSPMPSRRSAQVVADVAEALAHAHAKGMYHRRLTPHQVLLKESGAVRIVGLGVATALAPVGQGDTGEGLLDNERRDVQAIGRLLYACVTARWPGGHVDQLRSAPTRHGRLLRPRQVRAGVAPAIDTICGRILAESTGSVETHLSAADVAMALRRVAASTADAAVDEPTEISSPDLIRVDPVVEPAGPPPGLEPPRRRPKAYEPAPPTTLERGRARARRATRGDRGLVLLGVVGALALAVFIAVLAFGGLTGTVEDGPRGGTDGVSGEVTTLPIEGVLDFDPQGADGEENPDQVDNVVDGDPATGWRTSTYFNQAQLGGLKDGVGLVVDLGSPREITSMRIALAGEGTDLTVLASTAASDLPNSTEGLRRITSIEDAGADVTVTFPDDVIARQVVVWLQRLPQIGSNEYRGEIREISVRGVR